MSSRTYTFGWTTSGDRWRVTIPEGDGPCLFYQQICGYEETFPVPRETAEDWLFQKQAIVSMAPKAAVLKEE